MIAASIAFTPPPTPDGYLIALMHFVCCMAAIVIGICRNNAMEGDRTFWRVRVEYATYIGMMVASGLGPLYGQWPGLPSLILSGGIVAVLLLQSFAWRDDRAPDSASRPAPLGRK